MMYDSIKNFNKQFEYQPVIENADKLIRKSKVIVAGMGGSGHPAMLLKDLYPEIDIIVHRNYGLPRLGDEKLNDSLIIASSYSGNTEEPIDAFNTALQAGLSLAVMATGGKLLELAKENKIPFVQMPVTHIQPRTAFGYNMLALLKIMGREDVLQEISGLSSRLNPSDYEESGKQLAQKLQNKTPIVYASSHNRALAYVWKINFNETGKIPAFCNVFPELNHNEMEGMDVHESTKHLSENLSCIILKDSHDDPRVIRRLEVLAKLYRERGIDVHEIALENPTPLFKIFSSITLSYWASFYTAQLYGVDSEQVPVVEEFKKMIG
jgi:glucose/mannose-6-phosphate isomerase